MSNDCAVQPVGRAPLCPVQFAALADVQSTSLEDELATYKCDEGLYVPSALMVQLSLLKVAVAALAPRDDGINTPSKATVDTTHRSHRRGLIANMTTPLASVIR